MGVLSVGQGRLSLAPGSHIRNCCKPRSLVSCGRCPYLPHQDPQSHVHVLVTRLWCRLRGAHGLRGSRTQGSQKLLSDVDSARPLTADREDWGVGRLLGALPGTLVRQ